MSDQSNTAKQAEMYGEHFESHGHDYADVKDHEAGVSSWSPEEEGMALRKLDWCLIPLLGAIYMCSYIDRGNIGNAKTAGMTKELHINADEYAWLITMYYIAYIAFHWTILVWKVVNIRIWVATLCIGFGGASMLQAACNNWAGLMAVRAIIGVFEAGFAPGVALFLSFFYSRREMGFRYGLFIGFSALANCFASALAYGIVQAPVNISAWRFLFILEGIPTLIVAVVAYFYIPNGPKDVRFLTERQNMIVSERALKNRGEVGNEGKINFAQSFSAFKDYKCYFQAFTLFCLHTSFGSLPAFLPTIVKEMGFTSIHAQGLSAPPYFLGWVVCVGASFLSDRVGQRGIFIMFLMTVGGIGYLLLALFKSTAIRYTGIYFITCGVFPSIALNFTWMTDNQGPSSKRGAGLAIFGMIGQSGSFLGARIFPDTDGPYYVKGMAICAGSLFVGVLLTAALSMLLRWENRRRDKQTESVANAIEISDEVRAAGEDHPSWRFVV